MFSDDAWSSYNESDAESNNDVFETNDEYIDDDIFHNKLLPAAELQIQKRKLKQRPTNRLQPQPQNVLMYVTKNIFRI